MTKKYLLLPTLCTALGLSAVVTNCFAQQTIQVQNDNTLSMGSWGAAYSTNLWSSSYIGFNLKKAGIWGGPWATFTDGANNGAAGIVGGIGGTLQFLTMLTSQPTSSGQTFQDADMPTKVRMVLNEKGQLRIGTKSSIGIHSDYKLSVYGKITALSLYVLPDNATNWADYVFADGYRLTPLPELETFLKANRHLPEMPTTCEVEENGINIAAINALLLKKIEELTLHLIEMDKRIAQLEAAQKAEN